MSQSSKPDFVITIGASAGGLNAISELVTQLHDDMNAAVFIVLHLSKVGLGDFLVHRLQKYTTYSCSLAVSEEPIRSRHIYIAPPDKHLVLQDDRVIIGKGPAENRWRPSIDVLFRSAAVNYGNRVIGIILTGYLNDGTAGMDAIKRSGGSCIVQDPNEAEYPDMPLSVLETMEVDYCVPLDKMGDAIKEIIEKAEDKEVTIDEGIKREAEISEKVVTRIEAVAELGDQSLYACPDCGGGLWHINDKTSRYRCHIGHSYTERDLLIKQAESIEATLWVALRMMEERRLLLKRTAESETRKGLSRLSSIRKTQTAELEKHIEKLKELLFNARKD